MEALSRESMAWSTRPLGKTYGKLWENRWKIIGISRCHALQGVDVLQIIPCANDLSLWLRDGFKRWMMLWCKCFHSSTYQPAPAKQKARQHFECQ